MRFSDLVEKGLAVRVQTKGPTFEWDALPWVVACRGYLGREPTIPEVSRFYHEAPLGVQFRSPGETAVRLMVVHRVTWKQFLDTLRRHGL